MVIDLRTFPRENSTGRGVLLTIADAKEAMVGGWMDAGDV
jgi:hypothetical protein